MAKFEFLPQFNFFLIPYKLCVLSCKEKKDRSGWTRFTKAIKKAYR